MLPLRLKPSFKSYIWGGDSIKMIYKKETPKPPVAESWEISAHPEGLSYISGGEYDGMTILQLCEKYGKDFYGNSMSEDFEFPLLFKIIDAKDNLSIQVHPNDEYAFINENGSKGKTEAWYILHAEKGASLIYGFKEDVSKEQFKKAIGNGMLEDILNKVECKKGDVFYIPAGTVHAIGRGLLIAEIQQSSNITYRVYDYNRRDKEGKLRDLHIEKALDVSNLCSTKGKEKIEGEIIQVGTSKVKKFIDNDFFHFDEITIFDEYNDKTNNLLHMAFVAEGTVFVNGYEFVKGDSILLPASIGDYKIVGRGVVLRFW